MPIYTDFSSLLAGATIVCGLIWAIDAFAFKPKRIAKNEAAIEPKVVEYARSFFPILLIVCILRSFVAEPFRIPSGSMKPTLLVGDFILINKFDYGIRLPLFGTKIVNIHSPKRGDILVFRFPNDTSVNYIKRVIGVPGDKISYKDKTVYLNGKPVSQEFLGTLDSNNDEPLGQHYPVKHYREKLPEMSHSIIHVPFAKGALMEERTIPEGMYFVMGDNRDNSEDSRVWGLVPENLILGKAFFIWMSWDSLATDIRWQRIGHSIYQG